MNRVSKRIATKTAAREAGLRPQDEWIRREYECLGHSKRPPLVPRRDAEPVIVKGEAFYAENQCEPLLSKTAGRKGGLKLRDDAEPVTERYIQIVSSLYYVYRESDFVPIRVRNLPPPKKVDVLAATFAVNKAAKRRRENARRYYSLRIFSLASYAKSNKEQLNNLKERGIVAAYRAGRLEMVGMHGSLGIYRGEGYCFHSPLIPSDFPIDESALDSKIFVEASPRERSEGRLRDAIFTLEELSDDSEGFFRIERESENQQDRRHCHAFDDILNDGKDDDAWDDDVY